MAFADAYINAKNAATAPTIATTDNQSFVVTVQLYDPLTGQPTTTQDNPVNLTDIGNQITALQAQLTNLQTLQTDLQAVPISAQPPIKETL